MLRSCRQEDKILHVCWLKTENLFQSSQTSLSALDPHCRESLYHHCTSSMESVATEISNLSERGSVIPENTNLQLFSHVKFRECACVCSAAGMFFT